MQVDPIKPTLKPPGTWRLTLKYDKLLSRFAFNFNLRRFTEFRDMMADCERDLRHRGIVRYALTVTARHVIDMRCEPSILELNGTSLTCVVNPRFLS